MSDYDLDINELQSDFNRVNTDKTPGAQKKNTSSYLKNFVKMPDGDGWLTLRFLPALPGHKLPYAPCRVHNLAPISEREKKDSKKKSKNFYCGRHLVDGKWVGFENCFICQYYSHLYSERDKALEAGNEELAELFAAKAKAIKYSDKYYYNVIVLDSGPTSTGQGPEDGPLIYSCGIMLHTPVLEAVLGNPKMNKKKKGNIFHPIEGRNFKLVKKMRPGGQFPDYSGCEWEDPSPLSEDDALIKKWLDARHDIYSLCKVATVEEMKKQLRVFEGKEVDGAKAFDASFLEDQEEAPKAKSSAHFNSNDPLAPSQPEMSANVSLEDDDPSIDPEWAASVQNAIS